MSQGVYMNNVEIILRDGPFSGRILRRNHGTFDEGTLIHFDGFSYRIEWDVESYKWVGWCVDNGSL
jgi:hypothetical protein|tara:strand:+ start:554 stop:751 length:198 start_codon:yes stop_codon:yes gene_type:complete